MSTIAEPESTTEATWRAPAVADAPQIHALHDAWAEAAGLSWRESVDEITHEMTQPSIDLDTDVRIAEGADGTLLAAVWAHHRVVEGFKHRAYFFLACRPGHAALEDPAIEWAERHARARFAAFDDRMRRVIRAWSDIRDAGRIERLQAHGFEIARYFVDMTRPLDEPIRPVSTPEEVEILPWAPEWSPATWETHCEAFADHWGSLPPAWDDWQHRFSSPAFRPDLSLVAVAGSEVASYLLSAVFPHGWAHRGRKEGWIETLGTQRAWRRKGLASALITEAMLRYRSAGLDHAALGVDAANPTGAFGVYERLGFSEVERSVDLMKEIPV